MEGKRLTKEAVIEYALDSFHRKAGDPSVIMVGDRHYDIDGARQTDLPPQVCMALAVGKSWKMPGRIRSLIRQRNLVNIWQDLIRNRK
ncbi:MAG: hypothetical protein ACLUUO_01820 [Sellimonas intestinalis]